MSVYAITYYLIEDSHSCGCEGHDHDHHHERDDYEITAHIKALGSWAEFMPSSFLVKTSLTAQEILANLKDSVEAKDLIFVTKVDKDDVASLTSGVVEWINRI
jgi:hypothetical protein